MTVSLRPAQPDEAAYLTELCMRSKAVWGYDETFLAACRRELTIETSMLQTTPCQVAVAGGEIVGFAQVVVDGHDAELARLFVEPTALRSGTGRALFDWAVTAARHNGARWLWIESDPGAADFYRRMGAVDDGVTASGSVAGRVLPCLKPRL